MQIYSFLFKWKKNCQPNFKKKVSLQFVRTVYVCSNQLVASFEEAKKNRMSQIENELETSRLLRDWYRIHKRELPWRESSDPYIIWISEIILQQTRVAQGMDYFLRFTERFPDVASLASAEEDEVLKYWQGLGYYMMMYLAGLQGIPQELCEAATIDGANAVKVFTRIKLPMLKPYIWFCSLNSVISAIGVFDVVFVLTKGGPNDATMVINYYSYTKAFSDFQFGYAAAIGAVQAVVTTMLSIVVFVYGKRGGMTNNE